eukprot:6171977-Pleurochrysis_carterae.AAC.1
MHRVSSERGGRAFSTVSFFAMRSAYSCSAFSNMASTFLLMRLPGEANAAERLSKRGACGAKARAGQAVVNALVCHQCGLCTSLERAGAGEIG